MSRLLRADLDELDAYVTRIAAATGIPASHVEKDYWVTEVLRGAATASRETGCSVVFKGGTSLSKAHHLIQRFSEDVDLIAVLPAGGTKAKDTALKTFIEGAAAATGEVAYLASCVDPLFKSTIDVASYGGVTIGELLALRLNDVDWSRGTIRVGEGPTWRAISPSRTRRPTAVPLGPGRRPAATQAARAHRAQRRLDRSRHAAAQEPARRGDPPTNRRRREFANAVRAAKLEPLTPHDLRHTAHGTRHTAHGTRHTAHGTRQRRCSSRPERSLGCSPRCSATATPA